MIVFYDWKFMRTNEIILFHPVMNEPRTTRTLAMIIHTIGQFIKQDKLKFTNLKNLPKLFNFENNLTRDTPSEFAW